MKDKINDQRSPTHPVVLFYLFILVKVTRSHNIKQTLAGPHKKIEKLICIYERRKSRAQAKKKVIAMNQNVD